jgi:hypothetical protein
MQAIKNYSVLTLFLLLGFIFTGCSSKDSININKDIKSFSLNKEVVISSVPRTVKSPISVGLGLGGTIFRHVGVNVGTVINPKISNTDALNLERSLSKYNISVSNIVKNEFSNQMINDTFYKDKFVAFGSDYTIYLYVPKYTLESSLFNSNGYVKVYIDLEILDNNSQVIYSSSEVSEVQTAKENMLLNNKMILEKAFNTSVKITVKKLIRGMKSN